MEMTSQRETLLEAAIGDHPDYLPVDGIRNANWKGLLNARNAAKRAARLVIENQTATDADVAKCDALVAYVEQLSNEIDDRSYAAKNHGADRDDPIRSLGRKTAPDAGSAPGRELASTVAAAPRAWTSASALTGKVANFGNLFGQPENNAADGYRSFGEFAQSVALRDSTRLLNVATGTNDTSGVDGGFFVPSRFAQAILDSAFAKSVFFQRCRSISFTGAGAITVPMFDMSDRTKIAGMSAQWLSPGAPGTYVKPKATYANLIPKKLAIFSAMTNELRSDAVGFDSALQGAMSDAIALELDRVILRGLGEGQPLGIMQAPALITQTKDTSQAAATISYGNVLNMLSRLPPGSFDNATWIASPSTIPSLMALARIIQNVAGTENVGGIPVAPFTLAPDGSARLLTRPVIFTDLASQVGTIGDLMLVDFNQYLIALNGALRIDVDMSTGFQTDEVMFRTIIRVDGQPIQTTPYSPNQGSITLSPFVALQAR